MAGNNDDRAIKLGIQMTEVYQQFVSHPLDLEPKESYFLLLSSVIGAYASQISLSDMVMGMEAQIEALESLSGGNQ